MRAEEDLHLTSRSTRAAHGRLRVSGAGLINQVSSIWRISPRERPPADCVRVTVFRCCHYAAAIILPFNRASVCRLLIAQVGGGLFRFILPIWPLDFYVLRMSAAHNLPAGVPALNNLITILALKVSICHRNSPLPGNCDPSRRGMRTSYARWASWASNPMLICTHQPAPSSNPCAGHGFRHTGGFTPQHGFLCGK